MWCSSGGVLRRSFLGGLSIVYVIFHFEYCIISASRSTQPVLVLLSCNLRGFLLVRAHSRKIRCHVDCTPCHKVLQVILALELLYAMVEANPSTSSESQPRGRGRGRGKSRGGLGKYLRARGRGHSFGRPAEFTQRLVLGGEQPEDIDPEEANEIHQRYSKRELVSNADRYAEEEPQLGSEGA